MRKRLLVAAPYAVVPPRYGGPLRVYNLCRELARFFEVRQFAQQVQRRNVALRLDPVRQQPAPGYVEYSSRDPLSIALFTLYSLRWASPPVWQNVALRLNAPRWLHSAVAQADLIHVEHPWQFAWVHRANRGRRPLVFGTQNVEAALYTPQMLRAPGALRGRIVAAIEAQERFAARHADHIIAASEEDRAGLIARYGIASDRFTIVPNGVDLDAFTPASPELRERRKAELGLAGRQVVVFAGSQHPPNIEAVEHILSIARAWPDPQTCFLIVGTIGGAFATNDHPLVRFTGSVESTRPYFESADVALNPMLTGSGTNLKQLEFMGMGLATLATPVGARGIPIEDGRSGYVRPAQAFSAQLHWLLDHPDERRAVGMAGRRLVEAQFGWGALAARLANTYETLLQQKASTGRLV